MDRGGNPAGPEEGGAIKRTKEEERARQRGMGGNKPTEGGRENKDEQEAGVGVYLCLGGELFWPTGSWGGGGYWSWMVAIGFRIW